MTREEARNRIDAIIAKHEIDDVYVTITNFKDYDALRIARKTLEQEPCEDCISRKALLEEIENGIKAGNYEEGYEEYPHINDMDDIIECIKYADSVQPKPKTEWIPVTTRPLTDEEKEIHGEWEFMYDCSLPESGQDVLITDCYGNVEVDSFYNDGEYGCYFENNCDDDEVIAWMPLPKPYEVDKE